MNYQYFVVLVVSLATLAPNPIYTMTRTTQPVQIPTQPATILRNIINKTTTPAGPAYTEYGVELIRSNGKRAFLLRYQVGNGHEGFNYPLYKGDILKVIHGGQVFINYTPSGRTPEIDLIIGNDAASSRVIPAGSEK